MTLNALYGVAGRPAEDGKDKRHTRIVRMRAGERLRRRLQSAALKTTSLSGAGSGLTNTKRTPAP